MQKIVHEFVTLFVVLDPVGASAIFLAVLLCSVAVNMIFVALDTWLKLQRS